MHSSLPCKDKKRRKKKIEKKKKQRRRVGHKDAMIRRDGEGPDENNYVVM